MPPAVLHHAASTIPSFTQPFLTGVILSTNAGQLELISIVQVAAEQPLPRHRAPRVQERAPGVVHHPAHYVRGRPRLLRPLRPVSRTCAALFFAVVHH